jgi:hypothetical protein
MVNWLEKRYLDLPKLHVSGGGSAEERRKGRQEGSEAMGSMI